MTVSITATETLSYNNERVVHVISKAQYRVHFDGDMEEARIQALGLDTTIELESKHYPDEDVEALAVMLVASLEGGVTI